MGEFHYVDLFATKGIEYIVVIIYLIILIPFWKFLTRNKDSYRYNPHSHHSHSTTSNSPSAGGEK